MYESERKRYQPAPLGRVASDQVFYTDVRDGRSDHRLNDSWRQLNDIERGKRESDRMGERETCDYCGNRT